jgi:hypothetical protein
VTTISRLLHKHIVRYYAAWIEEQVSESLPSLLLGDGTEDSLSMSTSDGGGTVATQQLHGHEKKSSASNTAAAGLSGKDTILPSPASSSSSSSVQFLFQNQSSRSSSGFSFGGQGPTHLIGIGM